MYEILLGIPAEPRILMESTEPLTMDAVPAYDGAVSGDCIVQVIEVCVHYMVLRQD